MNLESYKRFSAEVLTLPEPLRSRKFFSLCEVFLQDSWLDLDQPGGPEQLKRKANVLFELEEWIYYEPKN